MPIFECICSFSEREQVIITTTVRRNISERALLVRILDALAIEEINQLRKMSFCQLGATEATLLPFIRATNGKYYFREGSNLHAKTLPVLRAFIREYLR